MSERAGQVGFRESVKAVMVAGLAAVDFDPDGEFAHLRDSDGVREETADVVLDALDQAGYEVVRRG